jgi:hypothetical protein
LTITVLIMPERIGVGVFRVPTTEHHEAAAQRGQCRRRLSRLQRAPARFKRERRPVPPRRKIAMKGERLLQTQIFRRRGRQGA